MKKEEELPSGVRYAQYLYATLAMSTLITITSHYVWTSPTIPKLNSEDSPIGVTLSTTETSVIATLIYLGVACGSIIAIYPLQHMGRRMTFILCHLPLFLGGFLILFANSALMLYFARLLVGISSGMAYSVSPIYNAEISESDIRGQVSTVLTIFSVAGSLFIHSVGPFISYHVLAIILTVLPAITACFVFFIPESPYYLVMKGKREAARLTLIKLSSKYSTEEFIDKRLDDITKSVENDTKNKSSFWEILKPEYRKHLLIFLTMRTIMYGSGLYCITSYAQTILKLSETIEASYGSIIFGVAAFVAALSTGRVIDKAGRKLVFSISCLITALSLFTEAIYFYLLERGSDVSSLFWLPITGLIIFEIFTAPGILGLPFIFIGEIFPINVKGVALAINSFLAAPLGLLFVLPFQIMLDDWGAHVPFWIYGGFCTFGFFFGVFYLPETKGKSLDEIQKMLNS